MSAMRAAESCSTPVETGLVLAALIEEDLALCVPVRGSSMRPTLRSGDRAIVAPFLGLPRPGQIVLARRPEGLLAHRLIRVDMVEGRRLYHLHGDAGPGLDAGVRREELLGRVVAVVREGVRLPIDDTPAALRHALRRVALRRSRRDARHPRRRR